MTADANFTALMLRLKGAFQNAKGSKIEARGQRYRYADFYVRLGAVTMGPSTKGVSVEVSEHMTRKMVALSLFVVDVQNHLNTLIKATN